MSCRVTLDIVAVMLSRRALKGPDATLCLASSDSSPRKLESFDSLDRPVKVGMLSFDPLVLLRNLLIDV